jgi:hypothetical protein
MPIHDWTRAPSGYFHHFHQRWTGAICDGLNDGRLPDGYFALIEQHAAGLVPDVLTLQHQSPNHGPPARPARGGTGGSGGLAVADAPPRARFVSRAEPGSLYATRANRVVVRHAAGDRVAAVLEIVSPGNKNSRHAVRSLVEKSLELLRHGVNLLVVDLFPPSPRDPQGVHPLIWGEVREDEGFALPAAQPLTLAAYAAGPPPAAYVEPVAVGDPLPDMPVFLDADTYVQAPLEPTYQETWARCPAEFRAAVLGDGR